MWSVLSFELSYRFRRPATYIYLAILFLISFLFAATDAISISGAVGNIHKNSPYTIYQVMLILTLLGTLIISAVMGVPVYRDYEHHFHEIMFTLPVSKAQYLGGRFLGSYFTTLFIFFGIPLGILTGLVMPWIDKEVLGPFMLNAYVLPFLYIVIPNVFILGVMFFATGSLFRNQLAIYLQGMVFFIFYLVLTSATGDVENNPKFALFDVFGITPSFYITRYWTPFEKNLQTIPLESYLLWNRLLWIVIALIGALVTYRLFQFSKASPFVLRSRNIQKKISAENLSHISLLETSKDYSFSTRLQQWLQMVRFDFFGTIRSVPFIAIWICGVILILGQMPQIGKMFGTTIYPVTYAIIDDLTGNFTLFTLIIITFYSGELVWKERERGIHLITDSLPVSRYALITAKFFAMCLIVAMMQFTVLFIGILIQTLKGFYRYDIDVYLKTLFVSQYPSLILLVLLAFFIHSMVNNKFIGHTLMIAYFVGRMAAAAMGITHKMIWYGNIPSAPYSDMNGYGHFLYPKYMFLLYWGSLGLILFVLGVMMNRHGSEIGIKARWKIFLQQWKYSRGKKIVWSLLLVFIVSGCFIFYNTNILHKFKSDKAVRHEQAEYEKRFRKYLDFNQPRITAVNVNIDLVPAKRYAAIKGYYIIQNKSALPIDTFLITWAHENIKINRFGFDILADEVENYQKQFVIYKLAHPLQPNDSTKVYFDIEYINNGFANSEEELGLVNNGTFVNNNYLPAFGYSESFELTDNSDRKKEELPRKNHTMRLLSDSASRNNTYLANDADWIRYECIISTSPDQIAVSPGYLQKEWTQNGSRYFHYKMDAPMVNFYSFLSARYEVFRDSFQGINIEIFYHKTHSWNIEKMNKAIKKTLAYCQKNFSPYQFRQVRILEFPRYETFAQSFPNTIPFSEAIGFIYDVSKDTDIDNAFYVTSHEVAHQWWGHQVCGANSQGSTLMVESMAQYTALMVMEKEFGKDAMEKFLKYELDGYLSGRSIERINEQPIARNDGQGYIHYQKGSLVMYAMKDYLGEDTLNAALHRFIKTYGFQSPPYVQAPQFVQYIADATPDSLKQVIEDMFNRITLFDLKCVEAAYKKKGNKYEVTLDIETAKIYADSMGNETGVKPNDWIDVGIMKYDGTGKHSYQYLQKQLFTGGRKTLVITVDNKPSKAGIDPLHKLIDRNSEDNIKEVKSLQ